VFKSVAFLREHYGSNQMPDIFSDFLDNSQFWNF